MSAFSNQRLSVETHLQIFGTLRKANGIKEIDRSHRIQLYYYGFSSNQNRLIIIEQSFDRCNQMKSNRTYFCMLLH